MIQRMVGYGLRGVLLAALLGGCASTQDARFYTLDAHSEAVGEQRSPLVLALGPIDLPAYLDRPQIVSRVDGNRLQVDEFHRWGGALDEEVSRLLAGRLGRRLGTPRIYSYPSRIAATTDYRIALDIRAFDGVPGGEVTLDVAWSLIDERSAKILSTEQSVYRATADGVGYEAYAAALSVTLQRLADDLAAHIERIAR